MAAIEANNILSTQKSTDSNLQAALHPLVLLTISDYITRHSLREEKLPILGALLGQQNGREITVEHAFECKCLEVSGNVVIDQTWLDDRLQQMRDVHADPPLDLVGWFTVMPNSGPQQHHLGLHRQILAMNESAILLGFQLTSVVNDAVGGKLPLTVYESIYEAGESKKDDGEDKQMKDGDAQLMLKFRELPYTVETGEAEMISVDFVAQGGGNATAIDNSNSNAGKTSKSNKKPATRAKGKDKDKDNRATQPESTESLLSREDEEKIAALTARTNAIRMLQARLRLITAYLEALEASSSPPSSSSSSSARRDDTDDGDGATMSPSDKRQPAAAAAPQLLDAAPNPAILRAIQALLARLRIVAPSDAAAFATELAAEENDVCTAQLLALLTESVRGAREVGRKSHVVEAEKKEKKGGGYGSGSGGNNSSSSSNKNSHNGNGNGGGNGNYPSRSGSGKEAMLFAHPGQRSSVGGRGDLMSY